MPAYTKDEIKAKLIALDAKIAKAEEAQHYVAGGPGGGMQTARGDLGAMYRERKELRLEYERLETLERGPAVNRTFFGRER